MKMILLILCTAFSITAYSQNLRELELITISGFGLDSAEIKLKSWGYNLIKVENSTVDSINRDIYVFQKSSSDYYTYSTVLLSKNKTDKMRAIYWDVSFVSFSEKRFDELRQECITAKAKFSNEGISGESFIRNYKDSFFDYSFIMENAKDKKSPIYYYVKIKCNPANMLND